MRRREFAFGLGAAGAAMLTPAAARAQAPDPDRDYDADITDLVMDELEAIQGQRIDAIGRSNLPASDRSVLRINGTDAGYEVPPLNDELRALLAQDNYWALSPASRPQPGWAGAARAPDYQHLAGFALSSDAFELSAGVLRRLAEANSFVLNDRRPVLIFGLRGCRLLGEEDWAPWAAVHRLEAVDPTHLECRCLIGVLRKSDGMIALFRASTLPAVAAMYKSLNVRGGGTSMLPTGLYAYSVGVHLANKPLSIQRGALRIRSGYCVLRTADDLTFDAFSAGDAWTRGEFHNIHAGGSNLQRYGSNGCQVIPGGYAQPDRLQATGHWAEFRRAAGIVDDDGVQIPDDESPSYQYMLLTGREAALAYQGGQAFHNGYRRLRPGSTGEAVTRLQRRLFSLYTGIEGARADGQFGMLTSFAVLLNKKETEGEYTSPIALI